MYIASELAQCRLQATKDIGLCKLLCNAVCILIIKKSNSLDVKAIFNWN